MVTDAKIIRKTSPYLRRPNANVTRMMSDVTVALLPVAIFSVYSFGWSALIIIGLSILSMMLTEYVYYQVQDLLDGEQFKWKNKSFTLHNASVLTSGLIYGLTLPDQTPWYVVVVGGVLGIYLAKLIFGGMGQNIFNPAAVARVIVVVIYAARVFGVKLFGDYSYAATIFIFLQTFSDFGFTLINTNANMHITRTFRFLSVFY